MMNARPGYRIKRIGPPEACLEFEVPNPDYLQEQIDLIRWVVAEQLGVQALDTATTQAREANPELFSNTDTEAALRARIAELESRPPEIRTVEVEKIVERVVEVPAVVEEAAPVEPYTPDFTLIPDALAKFAEADETADDFRKRLKRLWQRFGIADGENFPGGGEPLTGEEKITMREIDIVLNSDEGRNAGLLQWLQADERNT